MSNIFASIIDGNVTVTTYLICAAVSLVCGLAAAFSATYKNSISKGFFISLVLLPVIVQTVIIMVNGNIGTGVAVMGAFSLIRFRSAPGKAKDIVNIFVAMTAGLICAAGYVAIALLFTAIVCILLIILNTIPFGSDKELDLTITVPESLNYCEAFNDLFSKYTRKHHLNTVKTTNMGSLYRLSYRIQMKNRDEVKNFIDDLRCRNGNLEIRISDVVNTPEEL